MMKKFIVLFLILLATSFQGSAQIDFGQKGNAIPLIPRNTVQIHAGVGYPSMIGASFEMIDGVSSILNTILTTANLFGVDAGEEIDSYVYLLDALGDTKKSPLFMISAEYALTDNLSFGPYFSYAWATTPEINWNIPDFDLEEQLGINIPILNASIDGGVGKSKIRTQVITIGGKASWHTNFFEKIDVYAIGGFGFNLVTSKSTGDPAPKSDVFEAKFNVPDFSYSGHIGAQYFFNNSIGMYLEVGYGIGANIVNGGLSVRLNNASQE